MNFLLKKKWPAIFFISIVFFGLVLFFNFNSNQYQHFSYLAETFLKGRLDFLQPIPSEIAHDTTEFNGKYYWTLAPFPGAFLVPFVALFSLFGTIFYQGYLQFFLTVGIFWLCFKLARKHNYSEKDSFYLAFAFCFASVYQFIAFNSASWFFVQAISVFLIFLAIYEYFGTKRYWLIGILLAFVFMSRFTAGLGILFFVFEILSNKNYSSSDKKRFLFQIFFPAIIAGLLLLTYNYARFNKPFENGYMIVNNYRLTYAQRFETLNYGLFKLKNVPTNLYYYFIKTFDPVLLNFQSAQGNTYVLKPPYITVRYPGVGFFVTAPIFLYVFRTKIKEKVIRLSLIPVIIILILLMFYYWPGWIQIGPRYMLDLLPFAFLLLLFSFKNFELSRFSKFIIISSSVLNFYLFIVLIYRL